MGVTEILADYSGFAAGKEGRKDERTEEGGREGEQSSASTRAMERASEHAHNMPFLVTCRQRSGESGGRDGGTEASFGPIKDYGRALPPSRRRKEFHDAG